MAHVLHQDNERLGMAGRQLCVERVVGGVILEGALQGEQQGPVCGQPVDVQEVDVDIDNKRGVIEQSGAGEQA